MVAGVTGKYCSGKSTLSAILTDEYEFLEIDVDKLGHRALEAKSDEITAAFGTDVAAGPGVSASQSGRIDRRKLGDIVFSDPHALKRLESIVHPVMRAEVVRFLDSHQGKDIVINAAVLFTMRLEELCDLVIVVDAPLIARVRRARRRDSLSIGQVFRRFAGQRKMRLQSAADGVDIYTVYNDGDRAALVRRVSVILEKEGYR